MSKSATILGLAAMAAAGAPAYSSAAAYGSSSAVWSAEPSSSYAWPASSSAAPYGSSAAAYGSSWYSAVPSSSYVWSAVASSSYPYYPSASASVLPSSAPYPACWTECFSEAGVTSESDLCGNVQVDKCIHDGCCKDEAWAYWQWYDSFCGAPSSSYVIPYSTVPVGPASSSAVPSSPPIVECWGKCFAENDITSEDELCGNTAVDACISETCSCEEDKAYWQWYESYCTAAPSSSASPTVPTVPTSTPEDCWGKCFEEAGIASEDELCGNTAVDACIHDTCSAAEDKAYWEWYLSYCPVTEPVTTPCVTPTPTPVPTGNCWTACFAEYDVTSEASLCGNDEVSKCIHDTCSAALDKAYWDWYNGYCAAASTTVIIVTTVYTPTTTPYSPVTTTYEYTSEYGYTPVESSPATGLPVPPGYPASSYAAPASGAAAPTGYAAPSASAWAPVPATGAGAVTKPGVLLAAAMAFAALF